MEFMAYNSYKSAHRRPSWQKSMDSQEFGFASDLRNSMEVAPADELFFKGQLLPLHMDPRLHLLQALSCAAGSDPRARPSRSSCWSNDDGEVIENNSCWIGNEDALPCRQYNQAAAAPAGADSMVDHASSHVQGLDRQLSMLSWCQEAQELPSFSIEGDMVLDNKPSSREYRIKQPPRHDRDAARRSSTLSIWRREEEIKGPCLSNCSTSRDEEISFNSCRMEGDHVDVDDKEGVGNVMMDLRSASFRSHNSGFWESGADKDTGDSSSSSRDSNGSSQDSYFPNSTKLEAPHHPHSKASFNIPWKSLIKKAPKKQNSSPSIPRMGYPSSKYKECSAPSRKEAAEVPWKLDSVANDQMSTCNQEKRGKGKGISSSHDRSKRGFKSASAALCDAAKEDVRANQPTASSKSSVSKGKLGERDEETVEMKRKQRSSAMKETWQGYARRLRPLYEMKKGLMGQFRMHECRKNACEVESGNIYAGRTPAMRRRLSHQSSLFESRKLIIQEQNYVVISLHQHKGSNMLAMSSCPPSTRSSPNHSGVLAVIDPKQKSTTLQVARCSRKTMNASASFIKDVSSNKIGISTYTSSNHNGKATGNGFSSSNYTSMSTMQELQSALQGAIAHCKESNQRLDIA